MKILSNEVVMQEQPVWSDEFIGKKIDPSAFDKIKSDAVTVASRSMHSIAFKSLNARYKCPAEIEIKILTGPNVIEMITMSVNIVCSCSPDVQRVASPDPVKGKDRKFALTLLKEITGRRRP